MHQRFVRFAYGADEFGEGPEHAGGWGSGRRFGRGGGGGVERGGEEVEADGLEVGEVGEGVGDELGDLPTASISDMTTDKRIVYSPSTDQHRPSSPSAY